MGMFDMYRVKAIGIRAVPTFNSASPGESDSLPRIKLVPDYDDIGTAPSVNAIWARHAKEHRFNKPVNFMLKPRVLNLSERDAEGNAPSANNPKAGGWLNMGSREVPLYGLRFCIKDWQETRPANSLELNQNATNFCHFDITYYIECKNHIVNYPDAEGTQIFNATTGEHVVLDLSGNLDVSGNVIDWEHVPVRYEPGI